MPALNVLLPRKSHIFAIKTPALNVLLPRKSRIFAIKTPALNVLLPRKSRIFAIKTPAVNTARKFRFMAVYWQRKPYLKRREYAFNRDVKNWFFARKTIGLSIDRKTYRIRQSNVVLEILFIEICTSCVQVRQAWLSVAVTFDVLGSIALLFHNQLPILS